MCKMSSDLTMSQAPSQSEVQYTAEGTSDLTEDKCLDNDDSRPAEMEMVDLRPTYSNTDNDTVSQQSDEEEMSMDVVDCSVVGQSTEHVQRLRTHNRHPWRLGIWHCQCITLWPGFC